MPSTTNRPDLTGKVCIVTGSNTGIGKETARGLAELGATVVLACRDKARGEAARDDVAATTKRSDVVFMPLDLADGASIREFGGAFAARFDRLDVLVNNAGVSPLNRQTTKDGFELTFGVNHLGTFLLTDELLQPLKKSAPSRIVVVSSRLHLRGKMAWDDLMFEKKKFSPFAAYNQSKLANVLFTKALAERLTGTGVTVNALHPGVVKTELIRDLPGIVRKIAQLFMVTPEQGAKCSIHVASSPDVAEITGAYFDASKVKEPAAIANDKAAQQRLWDVSEKLLGMTL